MLVEDRASSAAALARAFVRAGHACVVARSYEHALRLSADAVISASVVDIVLGADETGGLRLIPHLRDLPGRPPVVVITAFADLERVKTALNAGAAYLLEKPFRAGSLIEIVERLESSESGFSRRIDGALERHKLTPKEMSVARLLLKGLTSPEIAVVESNSEHTIRQLVTFIYRKCGVSSRAELFHLIFPSLRPRRRAI